MSSNKVALIIGINYIGTNFILNGCINDADLMASMLKTNYNYNSFIILTDDQVSPQSKPTYSNILNNLQTLCNDNSITELFFYYSGHGALYQLPHLTDGNNCIIPCDYHSNNQVITDVQLYDIIKTSNSKLYLMFDACHSASMVNLPLSYVYSNNTIIETKVGNNNPSNFLLCISGCQDNEVSVENLSSYTRKVSGLLTASILKVLSDSGTKISLSNLLTNVSQLVHSTITSQNVVMSSSHSIDLSSSWLNSIIPTKSTPPSIKHMTDLVTVYKKYSSSNNINYINIRT